MLALAAGDIGYTASFKVQPKATMPEQIAFVRFEPAWLARAWQESGRNDNVRAFASGRKRALLD